jgi:hypothetical protein
VSDFVSGARPRLLGNSARTGSQSCLLTTFQPATRAPGSSPSVDAASELRPEVSNAKGCWSLPRATSSRRAHAGALLLFPRNWVTIVADGSACAPPRQCHRRKALCATLSTLMRPGTMRANLGTTKSLSTCLSCETLRPSPFKFNSSVETCV